jgi:hypothetical protein
MIVEKLPRRLFPAAARNNAVPLAFADAGSTETKL